MVKITTRLLVWCLFALLTPALAACGASTGDGDPDENTAADQQPLLTVHNHGWAWVGATGALGGSYVRTGSVSATRTGTGIYSVSVTGGGTAVNPTAQVVAYSGTDASCELRPPVGSLTWRVVCSDASGARTDSTFVIVFDDRGGTSAITRGAYLRLYHPTAAVVDSWNSSGIPNSATWSSSAQEYVVTLPGLVFSNASVHVSSVNHGGLHRRCKVRRWVPGRVWVKCFSVDGTPTQGSFTLGYHEYTQFGTHAGGHAWVTGGSPHSSYTKVLPTLSCGTPGSFSTSPQGMDLLFTLPDAYFPPTSWTQFVPMVTAYGSSSDYCKVVSWGGYSGAYHATVRCYDDTGSQIPASSTPFTLTITDNLAPAPC